MSKVEFDRLLHSLRMALEAAPQKILLTRLGIKRAAENRERQPAPLAPYPISGRLVRRLLIEARGSSIGLLNNRRKTLIIY